MTRKRHRQVVIFVLAGLAGLAGLTGPVPVAAAAATGCQPTVWQPAVQADYGAFTSVSGTSSSDVWAVGFTATYSPNLAAGALIYHWDGSAWHAVPAALGSDGALNAVSAVAPDDVWADGFTDFGSVALVEHWNGVSWQNVPLPPALAANGLGGISADGANDVWVVGDTSDPSSQTNVPTVLHWNGRTWSALPVPGTTGGQAGLNSVLAVFPKNVYVGGWASASKTLTAHWDGAHWTRLPTLGQPTNKTYEPSANLTARPTSGVWAVGGSSGRAVGHWAKGHWRLLPPAPGPQGGGYFSVASPPAGGVWVAGSYPTAPDAYAPLLAHWTGSKWQRPALPVSAGILNDVTVQGAKVWAAGSTATFDLAATGHAFLVGACATSS